MVGLSCMGPLKRITSLRKVPDGSRLYIPPRVLHQEVESIGVV